MMQEGAGNADPDAVCELTAFARQGWHYMMRVCELEYTLWGHFFPEGTPTQGLRSLVEAYNTLLYDSLRPMYIHESTFEELVDCVHVSAAEIGGFSGWELGGRDNF